MKRICILLLLAACSLGVAHAQKKSKNPSKKSTNLVVNGDFSQGDTGFTTTSGSLEKN